MRRTCSDGRPLPSFHVCGTGSFWRLFFPYSSLGPLTPRCVARTYLFSYFFFCRAYPPPIPPLGTSAFGASSRKRPRVFGDCIPTPFPSLVTCPPYFSLGEVVLRLFPEPISFRDSLPGEIHFSASSTSCIPRRHPPPQMGSSTPIPLQTSLASLLLFPACCMLLHAADHS